MRPKHLEYITAVDNKSDFCYNTCIETDNTGVIK
jgi:hypothetical protein